MCGYKSVGMKGVRMPAVGRLVLIVYSCYLPAIIHPVRGQGLLAADTSGVYPQNTEAIVRNKNSVDIQVCAADGIFASRKPAFQVHRHLLALCQIFSYLHSNLSLTCTRTFSLQHLDFLY